MRSDFSRQRPIRLFGVVSDSLKMIFPHATTRPLKAMEAYRVAVMGFHRYSLWLFLGHVFNAVKLC